MLNTLYKRLSDFGEWISNKVIMAGRFALALMMMLITTDVVLRYFFNRPIAGSYELVEFMMAAVVFFGLAYTQIQKDHLSVTLLSSRFSPAVKAVIGVVTYFLSAGIFAVITWRCLLQAETVRLVGESSEVLGLPQFPIIWAVGIGSALLALIFLIDFLKSLADIFTVVKNPWAWLVLDALVVGGVAGAPYWMEIAPWEFSRPLVGLLGIILMLLLLFSNMPIGPVMALVGFLGFAFLVNWEAAFTILGTSPYSTAANQPLSTIPLFVLMGVFCFYSDISAEIYYTVRTWMGRLPGGLAMSTVGACAGFAAVSGSSLATAVTMGSIALPEMKKYDYDDSLACGCIASGGSIGILIPPSVPFIIYASLSEESIGKLFMAGVIPGVLEAVLYILTIWILCKFKPTLGPPGPLSTWREKIVSLKGTWSVIVLFILVIGGIYAGIFTPTEAAGIGAFGAMILGVLRRRLNRKNILLCLAVAAKNTTVLLLMLIGADIFGYFLTMSQIPFLLSEWVVGLPVSNAVAVWAILLVYVVLGSIMPIMPAIILTVPIFLPVVRELGYDAIWFGVLVVTMAEIGQITPPVGVNVFTLAGVAKDVPLGKIYKGILPFLAADILRVALIFFLPWLALWLPSVMY